MALQVARHPGQPVFVQHCAGCHGANAEGKVGPALKGTSHREAEIQRFVTDGIPPKMPAFAGKLQPAQITAVAAYVKSLGPAAPGGHMHKEMEHDHAAMQGAHEHGAGMAGMMRMNRTVGQEMSRLGSGTAWEPESSPMWAKMAMWGKWMLMQHGNAVIMYDAQGGPRGVSRAVASNWYMAMGMRPLGKGDLMVRTMLSLEPVTFGNNGQPQLFQTGEGVIDRQHPHDLFMEIAAQYSHPLGSNLGAYLYLAPVGEPALGPVAFMHRVSSYEIPTAPLIHHWSDSTHISYGVATAGLQSKRWKGEVSWFNGHEPDGQRWAIDPLALNSVSGRLSYAPNPNWVMQFSRGHIDQPELYYEPAQGSVDRTTFSIQHNRPLPRGNWASTFVWGRNEGEGTGPGSGTSDAFLLESSYNWADRNYLFGRVERVDKDELFGEPDPRAARKFMVNAFSLGYSRDIGNSKSFETALGAMATVYAKSSSLDRTYGDFPAGVQVFLRIRPRRMQGMMAGQMKHPEAHHPAASPTPLATLIAHELAVADGRLPATD
jgi:cytochrome c553